MPENTFDGFPSTAKATAIPNLFFSGVLPQLDHPAALLAFLFVSRQVQQLRAEDRHVSADELRADPDICTTFENLAGGIQHLERGLNLCTASAALLAIDLAGPGTRETRYFVNNESSRRMLARVRAGNLQLRPTTTALPTQPLAQRPPDIFRLYETHIGTITPIVGEALADAADAYPGEWIEDAFREAATRNVRNWRYIERILQRWAEEGRDHETPGRDSLEERKRRYLAGAPPVRRPNTT